MGYFDYLKQILRPLGIYDLENGIGAEELRAIGNQLDQVFSALEELCAEALPATAEGYGISMLEQLLPYRPAYITPEDARRAIMALTRIRQGCFTVEQLNDTLYGCGLSAEIAQTGTPMKAQVSFPQNRGVPQEMERLKARVEQIVPCHLEIEYIYLFPLWSELMSGFSSWGQLGTGEMSWRDLEGYVPAGKAQ